MPIVRALMLGAVAGMRSMLAPAAISKLGIPGKSSPDHPLRTWIQSPDARLILTALALGELIADKLPFVPSRKAPPAFLARVFSGALSAAALNDNAEALPLVLIFGAAGSVLGTWGGSALRSALAEAFGKDFPAALLEDCLAVALACSALADIPAHEYRS